MKRIYLLLLGILPVLLCTADLSAQSQTVGTMTLDQGVVKLRRNQVDQLYRTTGEQIPVINLDEIQTGKDSKVTIQLKERDDKLELYSQSFFKIDHVTKESSELSMSIGKARFTVAKRLRPLKPRKKRNKRFRVRTANAIVGVKGTEFLMTTGADVTNVLTIEGVVDVSSVNLPDVVVEVSVNQVTQIKQASTPTAPVSVPPDVKETILSSDTPNAFSNVSFGATVPTTPQAKPEPNKKSPESGAKSSTSPTGKQDSSAGSLPVKGASSKATGGVTGATGLLTPDSNDDGEGDDGGDSGQPSKSDQPPTETGGEGNFAAGTEGDTGGEADFATGAGDDEAFAEEGEPNDLESQDAINLETLEPDELEEIDVEEPDIDPDDLEDIDVLIDDIEGETDDLQDEIEDIQDNLDEELQEIQIKINHQ